MEAEGAGTGDASPLRRRYAALEQKDWAAHAKEEGFLEALLAPPRKSAGAARAGPSRSTVSSTPHGPAPPSWIRKWAGCLPH